MGRSIALVLLFSLTAKAEESGPDTLRQSPQWMPHTQETQRDAESPPRRWGVFSAGVTMWAAGYAADVGVTYGLHHADPARSLIPVVGPLVQLGDKYTIADAKSVQTGNPTIDQQSSAMIAEGNQAYQALVYTGLAVDAALQLAGVVTAIAGAATHKRRPARLMSSNGRAALSITF
jgi:hypothetical protein